MQIICYFFILFFGGRGGGGVLVILILGAVYWRRGKRQIKTEIWTKNMRGLLENNVTRLLIALGYKLVIFWRRMVMNIWVIWLWNDACNPHCYMGVMPYFKVTQGVGGNKQFVPWCSFWAKVPDAENINFIGPVQDWPQAGTTFMSRYEQQLLWGVTTGGKLSPGVCPSAVWAQCKMWGYLHIMWSTLNVVIKFLILSMCCPKWHQLSVKVGSCGERAHGWSNWPLTLTLFQLVLYARLYNIQYPCIIAIGLCVDRM